MLRIRNYILMAVILLTSTSPLLAQVKSAPSPTDPKLLKLVDGMLALGDGYAGNVGGCEAYTDQRKCARFRWRDASEEVSGTLINLRAVIHEAARIYGVDPRAIAGSILAEHTMNTSASDYAQNLSVRAGNIRGEAFGRRFTFGFGQFHFDRAAQADTIASKVENRPLRSDKEISDAMLSPEGSIFYVAALLKYAQDTYRRAGYPIDDNLGALGTLYNIGKIEQRLARTKAEKRLPQPNYFGVFVEAWSKRVSEIVDYPGYIARRDQARAAAQASTALAAPVATVELQEFHRATKLDSAPAGCDKEPVFLEGSTAAKLGDRARIVGRDVDCKLKPWVLVQLPSGAAGWISQAGLDAATKKLQVPADKCSQSHLDGCRSSLRRRNEKSFAGNRGSELEFWLFDGKTGNKVADLNELLSDPWYREIQASGRKINMPSSKPRAYTEAEIKQVKKLANTIFKKSDEVYQVAQGGSNPYRRALAWVGASMEDDAKLCDPSCFGHPDETIRYLQGLKVRAGLDAAEVMELTGFTGSSWMITDPVSYQQRAYGAFNRVVPVAIESVQSCQRIANRFPGASAAMEKLKDSLLASRKELYFASNAIAEKILEDQKSRAELLKEVNRRQAEEAKAAALAAAELKRASADSARAAAGLPPLPEKAKSKAKSEAPAKPEPSPRPSASPAPPAHPERLNIDPRSADQIYDHFRALAELKDYCRSLELIVAPPKPEPKKTKTAGEGDCADCRTTVKVFPGVFYRAAQEATLKEVRESLPDAKSQDDYLTGLLQAATLPKRADDSGYQKGRTLRELAEILEKDECSATVYVPFPWLATSAKRVYRPNEERGKVGVSVGAMKCAP